MSRPNTRSKKRKGHENVNPSSEILRKIHETKEISNDDVDRLYMIWKTVCQGCRVNTKDNPNCFCGLIPPPNGSRKTGLWQKMADFINSLGDDQRKDLRASDDSPAGLTNLGATCYANSILQCLYMNSSFRKGVFSVEPDVLKDNPVLDQLARLFAELHTSKMAVIDSAPFIKTLELDNGVQQDSHEFFTLLLSLLERCLRRSKVSKAKTIVQDLFRGTVSHVTRCLKCGKDSEASSKMEDFYELELNVKGLKSLDESLDDYLNVEELCDENQYFCESCQTRVDATRSIKLRSLPVVLNFQLKRCVFLSKSTTKKKITSAFSFPGELDMRQRLSEPSNLDWVYDLSAVLIHKGTAVNSGHYIAHIKDVETGQWWEFDDEHVSNLGHRPFGDTSSRTAKDVQTGTVVHAPGDVASNGDNVDVQLQSAESCSSNGGERFSSTDAYMLMYNLRRTVNDDSSSDIKQDGDFSSEIESSSLPSHLFEDIERLNASLLDACQQYQLKKEKEIEFITERKQEVRSVLSEAPVQPLDRPFYWIATEWLRQWADCITAPGLDNTSIQCSHGKVPVSKVGLMKRISAEAWARLFSKYGGGPALTDNDFCTVCLLEDAKSMVYSDSYRDRRVLMKELAINALAGKSLDGTHYVSKAWLQQWLRRKVDAPTEADAGPTAAITCPHGQLMPEQASGAKRVLVPENLWLFFYKDATTVKSEDPLGCTTFPSDSEQCLQCADQLSDVASLEDSLRAVKLKQRQNHEKLAAGKSTPLVLNSKYYLVPTLWLTKWRTYINASGKNVSLSVEPESLDIAIGVLKCEKHQQLVKRPPELVYKRAVLYQKVSTADGLTIIEENDWNCFCEEWGASKENGISAIIESSENSSDTAMEDVSTTSEECSRDDPLNEAETRQPTIKTSPEICEECIGERESHELLKKLNYFDENISVTLVRGKEAPKSILEASETSAEPDRRASKRSRKTSDGNTVNLTVSGSTSIYQLKMMIWESLGVVKENQILHKGSRIIDQETGSLADWNIVAGDKLWVQDSEIHEHRDIADELAADQKTDTHQLEEGFRGTLLTSNISSEVV